VFLLGGEEGRSDGLLRIDDIRVPRDPRTPRIDDDSVLPLSIFDFYIFYFFDF
jgi:hypothetical protein